MHTAVAHRAEFIQELLRLVLQQAHLLLQPIGVFWADAADAMYVSVRLLFEVKQLRAEVHIEACGHQVSSVSLCFQHRMRRHLGRHGMRRGGAPTVRSLQMGVRVVGALNGRLRNFLGAGLRVESRARAAGTACEAVYVSA